MTYWYAVNSKPHRERQAEQNLLRLGVETFCPLLKQSKVIRRVRQTVIRPLFPGYLFAKFDASCHLRAVAYAGGVSRIVTFGGTPAVVDEAMIDSVKNRLQHGYAVAPSHRLKPGQVVTIQEGPLYGIEAVFEREMDDQERVVLLLRTLAYQARVVMPMSHVGVGISRTVSPLQGNEARTKYGEESLLRSA